MSGVLILAAAAAYVAGAIPFGLLIARAKGVDLRQVGSGNIGATNVARNLGMRWGLLTLLLDALKGFAPVLVVRLVLAARPDVSLIVAAAMVAAVVGHMFTIFLLLRGGKGVATALGTLLATVPLAGGVGAALYVGLYAATRISSAGSLALTVAAPVTVYLVGAPRELLLATLIIAALIIIKHVPNIRRLMRGEEGKV